MAYPKVVDGEQPHYFPLPSDHRQQPPTFIILPLYRPSFLRRRQLTCAALFLLLLAFLSAGAFFAWPSNPELRIVRLHLDRVSVKTSPFIAIDITMPLTVQVRNPDIYSIDYKSLDVAIAYRGRRLGFVTSDGGHVKARGSSYVDATLRLDGVEVFFDAIPLLEDLARGSIPFDTVTEIRGRLGLFFYEIPIKAKVSCEVQVNTHNQTIVNHNCYPQ